MPGFEGYDITHNKDGSITFTCTPTEAGTYRITVEKDGSSLTGLPICCMVQQTSEGYVTAYKTGVDLEEELTTSTDVLKSGLAEEGGVDPGTVENPVAAATHDAPGEDNQGVILSILDPEDAAKDAIPDEHHQQQQQHHSDHQQQQYIIEQSEDPSPQYMVTERAPGDADNPATGTVLVPVNAGDDDDDNTEQAGTDWGHVQEVEDPEAIAAVAAAVGIPMDQSEAPRAMKTEPRDTNNTAHLLMAEEDDDVQGPVEIRPVTIRPEPAPGKSRINVQTRRKSGRSIQLPAKYREDFIRPIKIEPTEADLAASSPRKSAGRPGIPVVDIPPDEEEELPEVTVTVKSEEVQAVGNTFPCPECGKVFGTMSRMLIHSKTHKDTVYVCDVLDCKKQFKVLRTLQEHRLRVHEITEERAEEEPEEVYCSVKGCQKSFMTLDEMRKHLTKSHKDQKICYVCYRVVQSNAKLKEHMQIHAEDDAFICTVEGCGKRFRTKRILEFHQKQHCGGELCADCGKSFSTIGNLNKHIETIHRNPRERKLGASGIGAPVLTSAEERNLMCDTCGKTFKNKSSLKNHIREMHVMEDLTVVEEDGVQPFRPFKCGYCGRGFKRQAVLREHIALHESVSRVLCTHPGCKKSFPTIFKLKDHVRMVHKDDGKRHICKAPNCGREFKRLANLNVHMRKHNNVRYPCMEDNCTRTFSTKFCMFNHFKLVHQNVEPSFFCEVCNKGFKLKLLLDRHMETHKDTRDFQCLTCGKTFKTKSSLISHNKIHFPDMQYHCELCPRSFPRKYRLIHHMATNHGEHIQTTSTDEVVAENPNILETMYTTEEEVEQTTVAIDETGKPVDVSTVPYEVQSAITELQNTAGKHILIIEQVDLPEGMEFEQMPVS